MFLKMLLENRFTLTYRSNDFLILFVTFWKLIRSHTVTPRWLVNAKECIQSGWSKQRDSLAHEILARMLVASKTAFLENHWADFKWIFDCIPREEASTSLSCVRFGSRAIHSGWKSAWRFKFLGQNLLESFPSWVWSLLIFTSYVEEPLEQRNYVLCSSEPIQTKECFEFRLGKHWNWIVRES